MIIPVPLAMVLCDSIIVDKRTEKKSLIGTFSNMYTERFPFRAQNFSIYVSLTNGHGTYDGKLICSDSDNNEVFKAQGRIAFPGGAKTVVEMVYDIGGLMFPRKGVYTFSFFCDNELVISRECKLNVIEERGDH